jgi:hypothetical protein
VPTNECYLLPVATVDVGHRWLADKIKETEVIVDAKPAVLASIQEPFAETRAQSKERVRFTEEVNFFLIFN